MSVWLLNLPDWARSAGLSVSTYPGWETRSRSSGGYDSIRGIGIHHNASGPNSSLASQAGWSWGSSPSRPVGAMILDRDGHLLIGAAGATNTQGRGGPVTGSRGTIPQDAGNRYMVSIEASNNGVGEPWPTAQQDAYVVLCRMLCDRLGLDPSRDIWAHFEWAPGRKIDPAGPSRWASGSSMWAMPAFRAEVAGGVVAPPPSSSYDPPADWGLYPLDPGKPTLRNGSNGEHVRYLQDALALGAGADVARDGHFGNQTETNVRQVQTAHGLVVDGVCGPQTWPVIDGFTVTDPPPPPTTGGHVLLYRVQPGDSYWKICEKVYADGKATTARSNALSAANNDRALQPGDLINVPGRICA